MESHAFSQVYDSLARESFGEEVGGHFFSGTVVNGDGHSFGDFITNPEFGDRNVFHA